MKSNWIAGVFLSLLVVLFTACEHDVTNIGLDLSDGLLGTHFNDTCTLSAYSFLEDTINTTNMSANLVGCMHDPVFGETRTTTYAQFDLTGSSVNFGTNPVVDSVVLTLQLASYYGDTTDAVAIRAYLLDEYLDSTKTYYNNSTIHHEPNAINYNNSSFTLHPRTPVVVDTGSYSPNIRIRLSNSFGQYLLDNQHRMYSNNSFKEFFKGLCITAASHSGQTGYMLLTNMNSSLTGITLYYHNNDKKTRGKSVQKYVFPCSKSCMRFTNYEHNYETSTDNTFIQEVLHGNANLGAQKLYFQAGSGVKTKITFPYLKEAFAEHNNRVVINRAELVIQDISPDELFYIHPAALTLQAIKKDGSGITYVPDDESFTSAAYYGGYYDDNKHEYRFRVTRYVQDFINENSNLSNELYVVVKGSAVRANRLIAGGTGLDNNQRIRLELSYTPY